MLASELVAILNRAISKGHDYPVFFTSDTQDADPVKMPVRHAGFGGYWDEDAARYPDAQAGDCITILCTYRGEYVSK